MKVRGIVIYNKNERKLAENFIIKKLDNIHYNQKENIKISYHRNETQYICPDGDVWHCAEVNENGFLGQRYNICYYSSKIKEEYVNEIIKPMCCLEPSILIKMYFASDGHVLFNFDDYLSYEFENLKGD